MSTVENRNEEEGGKEKNILGGCSDGGGGGAASVLPHELVVSEVLTRLACKPLARFKCVSNLWGSSIEDDCFRKVHYSRSRSQGGLLFVCPDFHDNLWFFCCTPSGSGSGLGSGPGGLGYVRKEEKGGGVLQLDLAHQFTVNGKMYDGFTKVVNGLFCAYRGHCMWVCKVSTNCSIELPPCFNYSRRQKFRFYLGFDCTRKEYKLLKLCFRSDPGTSHDFYFSPNCEILTLGKDDEWRSIPSCIPIDIWGESVFLHGSSTLFFWPQFSRTKLVAFSFKEEVFDILRFLPQPFKSEDHWGSLLQFGDHLALVEGFVDQKLELWVYGGKMPTEEEKRGGEQDVDVDVVDVADDNVDDGEEAAAFDVDVVDVANDYVDDGKEEAAAAAFDVDVADDYVDDSEEAAAAAEAD
ncbi:hypothetical protein RHMOL_Rhmol01G0290700 [Rhododendron molle]|uniref:Uncharacterized protein n=1 Tax=Rhododendron molle TaxID=49168 RepID=A0ACC0Q766_RHOML|nr:hypothetical protein RHMOL_Rhmol01G0290700 [Rhododendron molle]